MKVLLGAIGFVCAALYALTLAGALFTFNAQSRVLKPEPYKAVLLREHVYEQFPTIVAHDLKAQGAAQADSGFHNWTEAELEQLIGASMTPRMLQTMAEDGVDQMIDFMRGERAEISLSTLEFKGQFASRFYNAMRQALARKPECKPGEWASLDCHADARNAASQSHLIGEMGSRVIAAMPNAILYPETAAERAKLRHDFPPQVREGLMTFCTLSPVIPVVFLFLVAVIAADSARALARWSGVSTLVAGVTAYAIGIQAKAGFATWLGELNASPDAREPGAQFAAKMMDYVGQDYFAAISTQAIVVAVIGFLLLIGANFLSGRKDSEAPA